MLASIEKQSYSGIDDLKPPQQTTNSFVKKTPKPHQDDAIEAIINELLVPGDDVRTQVAMACGTGKTLTGQLAAERLGGRILVCEPSLPLIAQNLKEWRSNNPDRSYLVVCSDQAISRIESDDLNIDLASLQVPVTNDSKVIEKFLIENPNGTIFSTYHSLSLTANAQKNEAIPNFRCIVADEAHRTASANDSMFAIVHDNQEIRSTARLYMTATPKILDGDSHTICSMDNEKIFGRRCFELTLGDAINMGILSDYRVIVIGVTESELKKHSQEFPRNALAEIAVLRAFEQFDVKKILSFHSRVSWAEKFSERMKDILPTESFISSIKGSMDGPFRQNILNFFGEYSKGPALISNCRCLTEGVDVPAIDGVVLVDPRNSEIDLIQLLGRAIRPFPGKIYGSVIVPILVADGTDAEKALENSNFKILGQVLRGLRAHDPNVIDRFKAIIPRSSQNQTSEKDNFEKALPIISTESIPRDIADQLTARIIKIGLGLRNDLITESMIIDAARAHYSHFGVLPGQNSGQLLTLQEEKWENIYACAHGGFRGLKKGRTVPMILENLRKELGLEIILEESEILTAAESYYQKKGKLPTCASNEPVDEIGGLSWKTIHSCGYHGFRGMKKGRTLAIILEPLKRKYNPQISITDELVKEDLRIYIEKFGGIPTNKTTAKLQFRPNMTWSALFQSYRQGKNNVSAGQSLSELIPLWLEEMGITPTGSARVSKSIIQDLMLSFFEIHNKLPNRDTTDPVPGRPDLSWRHLDNWGASGKYGLNTGETLEKISENLLISNNLKLEVNRANIIEAIKKYFEVNNFLPSVTSDDQVPGLEVGTWHQFYQKLQYGSLNNVLKDGETLTSLIDSVRIELGLNKIQFTVEGLITAILAYHKKYDRYPTRESSEEVPGYPGESWGAIRMAGINGHRGLPKGTKLKQLVEEAKLRNNESLILSEDQVVKLMIEFEATNGFYPSLKTTEAVPGRPKDSWSKINSAGKQGGRGLKKGRTLSVIKKDAGLVDRD